MSKRSKKLAEDGEISFLDHLEELRWHLIRSTVAVLIFAVVAFIMKDFIFDTILFGPKNSDFPTYKLLCRASQAMGLDSFCGDLPFTIQSREMGGQFSVHIWTAITAGIIMAFPYIIFEVWKFIAPGLKEKERKNSRGFIFVSSFLFFIGVLFGYYVITPLSINFLGTYQVSAEVKNQFDIDSYISLVRSSVLAAGIVFQLPIIMYFLTKIGLVTPEILRKYRKMSLVVVLIISAVITPPDIMSQVIVAVPILILYEVSIYISKIVVKRQKKAELLKEKELMT